MSVLSESGIDTDGESSQDLRIVAIVPEKVQYDSKDPVVIVFNHRLPPKGPFMVDFVGKKAMQVVAKQLNRCTLKLEAPPYYPAEEVTACVYHGVNRVFLGRCCFEFTTRLECMHSLLTGVLNPVAFMCESLRMSPKDITSLDKNMASSFQRNIPEGFSLLNVEGAADGCGESESSMKFPTLLHFAAEFGLTSLVQKLMGCPGALNACNLNNKNGQRPMDLAQASGHTELSTHLYPPEPKDIYEDMDREQDPYYIDMQPEPEYIEMDGRRYHYMSIPEGADYYVYIKTHGYLPKRETTGPGGEEEDAYYMDMNDLNAEYIEKDGKRYYYIPEIDGAGYVDTASRKAEGTGDQIYEEMGHATEDTENKYDVPANVPAQEIPRSISVVMKNQGDRLPRPGIPRRGSKEYEGKSRQGEIQRSGSTSSRISNISNASSASSSSYSSSREADSESTDFKEEEEEQESIFVRREDLLGSANVPERRTQNEKPKKAPHPADADIPLPPPPDYDRKSSPASSPGPTSKPRPNRSRTGSRRDPAPPPPLMPRRQSAPVGEPRLHEREQNNSPVMPRSSTQTPSRPPPPLPREKGKEPPAPAPRARNRKN